MSKIRKSAKGEDCAMRLPGICSYNPEQTVWAHSNKGRHGKGMGLKANDEFGAYLCFNCHSVLDGQMKRPAHLTKQDVEEVFERAMELSRSILRTKGLLDE